MKAGAENMSRHPGQACGNRNFSDLLGKNAAKGRLFAAGAECRPGCEQQMLREKSRIGAAGEAG
jgi:hypothetical protein